MKPTLDRWDKPVETMVAIWYHSSQKRKKNGENMVTILTERKKLEMFIYLYIFVYVWSGWKLIRTMNLLNLEGNWVFLVICVAERMIFCITVDSSHPWHLGAPTLGCCHIDFALKWGFARWVPNACREFQLTRLWCFHNAIWEDNRLLKYPFAKCLVVNVRN